MTAVLLIQANSSGDGNYNMPFLKPAKSVLKYKPFHFQQFRKTDFNNKMMSLERISLWNNQWGPIDLQRNNCSIAHSNLRPWLFSSLFLSVLVCPLPYLRTELSELGYVPLFIVTCISVVHRWLSCFLEREDRLV